MLADVVKKVFNPFEDDAARSWFSHVHAIGYESTKAIVKLFEKGRSFIAEAYREFLHITMLEWYHRVFDGEYFVVHTLSLLVSLLLEPGVDERRSTHVDEE